MSATLSPRTTVPRVRHTVLGHEQTVSRARPWAYAGRHERTATWARGQ